MDQVRNSNNAPIATKMTQGTWDAVQKNMARAQSADVSHKGEHPLHSKHHTWNPGLGSPINTR